MEIYKAPPILFLSLKRFKSSANSYYKDKLEDLVNFPLYGLDLSRFIISNRNQNGSFKESILYDLYAVSNHYGNMGFGHYTAYGKNAQNGKWYDFDDSSVSPVDEDKIVTEAAYNLFYVRRGFIQEGDINFASLK
jgi:ubiquitin carboxyl-terminal hydrolase 4/11/15